MILKVQKALTDDLLSPKWKKIKTNAPLSGHCYIAAEAIFHLEGGKKAGCKAYVLSHRTWTEGLGPGRTHWFIRKNGIVLDPTSCQFETDICYEKAVPTGFLTKQPSRRAKIIINRVKKCQQKLR